jgi:hypothetical protein
MARDTLRMVIIWAKRLLSELPEEYRDYVSWCESTVKEIEGEFENSRGRELSLKCSKTGVDTIEFERADLSKWLLW